MKFKWTQEETSKILSNSATLIIAIVFFFLVKNLSGIFEIIKQFFKVLSPFIIGFAIAYLLSRPVSGLLVFFNRHLFKKSKKQRSINRFLSILAVILLALIALTLIIYSIIPQLIESVTTLAKNADGYIKTVNSFLDKFFVHFGLSPAILSDLLGSSQELFKKLTEYVAASLPKLLDFSVSVGSGISNFFIGFIVSIYMLSGRERFSAQAKKISYAIFPKTFVSSAIETLKYANDTFGKYLTGQILVSLTLGIICFILMSCFGMEYALLISMIVTITNFIPFIGPIIGAVPSAFILLMVQPSKVLWFILLIIVLQQLEGNFLAPRIVGKTTGLSSFWVIFSILIGGGLFGILGVVLAVPTFSVIYAFVKRFVDNRLKSKGLSQNTADYF